ncbi:MAG: hypothetical protein JO331_08990, partial [Verrucomicrobia bacterium]|nr:hypothetical protein [Verrucomicrobiota bacterium]
VLGSGESRTLDVALTAHDVGVSNWEWSISNPEHTDRVDGNITIQAPGSTLRETYLTEGQGGSLDLLQNINPQLTEGAGVVRVTLANTRLNSLQPAVTALRTYPYDCSEQLTSGLVPFLVEKQLRNALPTPVAATLDPSLMSGILNQLFERQIGSGGLALWPREDQASFFASAYAAYVMGGLRKLGVELPEDKYKSLLDYLAASLRGTTKLKTDADLNDDAFALLALATAGRPESSYMEELRRRLPELSRETRAVLALAYLNAGSGRATVDALLNSKTPAPEAESMYSGDAREPAIQLLAYTTAKSKSADIAPLLKELLGLRRSGSWQTTQENAWSLLACVNYYRQIETGPKKVDAQLVSGNETLPVHLEHQNPIWSKVFKFDSASPLKRLTIDSAAKGLYADTSFEVFPSVAAQPRQDRGFSVTREYWKINADGERVAAQNLQVGDRVLVLVQVTSRNPARLVAIDDSVPGNLEVINPDFRLSNAGADESATSRGFFDYRTIRDGHVQFFCNQLPSGSQVFSYLARVRLAGDTVAPGAEVLEMYRPERFGLSESSRVVTTAAGQ